MTGWAAQHQLASFRGEFPVTPLDARRVAGLLDVPGCTRRQVIDAATVAIDALAGLLGCPPGGQSPFAIARSRSFAQRVAAHAMGELLALVRERLGAPVTAVRQLDLSADQVRSQFARGDAGFRATLTSQYVGQMLAGDDLSVNLLRHPILTLDVGGAPIYVEPDLVSFTSTDPLHPVEIRSYPCVDGVADEAKVSATARELAVAVLATRQLAGQLGHDPATVASRGLLVLPRNFSLTATGETVDVAPQVRRLGRALDAFPDPATLARSVPGQVSLPALPGRDAPAAVREAAAAQAAEAVAALPPRFGDGCLSCALFVHCRAEQQASGTVARVGDAAVNACGEVGTVDAALALAHGDRRADSTAEQAVAADLARAATLVDWLGAQPVDTATHLE